MKTIITRTLLIGTVGLSCLAASAAHAVQGRAYVEREREIVKMTKQMVAVNDEVKAFGKLLEDLDDCDLSESSRDFWMTARDIKTAMEIEIAQARENLSKEDAQAREKQVRSAVQQAEMMETAPLDSSDQEALSPQARRLQEMELTYREAEGLRNPMSMHEESVIKRYRVVVGHFHELMQQEVTDMQSEIDTLRELNRTQR
jgi:hypothetical protein